MKKFLTVAVLVMAVVVAASCVGLAKGKSGKSGGMGGGMGSGAGMGVHKLINNPQFISELGLSDSQVEQLKALQSESQRDSIKMKAEMEILQMDLQDLLNQDNPDIKKIDSLIDQMGGKKTEMQKQMIHSMIDMKKVLTDEQKEKAKELMQQRMQQRSQGKNKGGGRNRQGGQDPGEN